MAGLSTLLLRVQLSASDILLLASRVSWTVRAVGVDNVWVCIWFYSWLLYKMGCCTLSHSWILCLYQLHVRQWIQLQLCRFAALHVHTCRLSWLSCSGTSLLRTLWIKHTSLMRTVLPELHPVVYKSTSELGTPLCTEQPAGPKWLYIERGSTLYFWSSTDCREVYCVRTSGSSTTH